MATTVEDFRTRFPEFSNVATYPDARVQLFLDDAALCIDEGIYGDMYDLAVCYLAAHELYLGTQTASSSGNAEKVGPVSSKSAGQVTVARGVASVDLTDPDAYYLKTTYGQKFINIRDKVKIPGFIVINNVGL